MNTTVIKENQAPRPLFLPLGWTSELSRHLPYPDIAPDIHRAILNYDEALPGAENEYIETLEFLILNGRKSEQTYNAFRTEVERFLLWSWTIKEKLIQHLRRSDLDQYIEFCMNPPVGWVGTSRQRHFLEADEGGELRQNKNWAPFRVKESEFNSQAKNICRKPAMSTLVRQFSILNVYFNYLVEEDYVLGNQIPAVKKYSPYLIKDTESPLPKRLSDGDWAFVVRVLITAADENPKLERNLFATITLKSLYLRISEISDRPNWQPSMGHFVRDKGYLWLVVFGRGNKKRLVSVPSKYIPYLQRYRIHRGLSLMPHQGEDQPLIHRLRGRKGLSVRQATRLIKESFDLAIQWLINEGRAIDATELQSASSHWLRHTGASQDTETRPIKHLADDLGHSSMGTIDRRYLQSDVLARAKTGAERRI